LGASFQDHPLSKYLEEYYAALLVIRTRFSGCKQYSEQSMLWFVDALNRRILHENDIARRATYGKLCNIGHGFHQIETPLVDTQTLVSII
jgi:hypothetical protein